MGCGIPLHVRFTSNRTGRRVRQLMPAAFVSSTFLRRISMKHRASLSAFLPLCLFLLLQATLCRAADAPSPAPRPSTSPAPLLFIHLSDPQFGFFSNNKD